MELQIYSTQCENCLFSRNRIVSKERATQIINDCKEQQKHFICHKTTIQNKETVCKGFYDTMKGFSPAIRIVEGLGLLTFVNQE